MEVIRVVVVVMVRLVVLVVVMVMRIDIPKALPILAQYLTVMSDLIVHPDAR